MGPPGRRGAGPRVPWGAACRVARAMAAMRRPPPCSDRRFAQARPSVRAAVRRAVVCRAVDKEQVLTDVRSIIAEQLGTDVNSVTVRGARARAIRARGMEQRGAPLGSRGAASLSFPGPRGSPPGVAPRPPRDSHLVDLALVASLRVPRPAAGPSRPRAMRRSRFPLRAAFPRRARPSSPTWARTPSTRWRS